MKQKQTFVELKTLVNLQIPNYDNSLSDLPSQDKIKFRRDRVNRLRISGYSNEDIAGKIGCSLSTVEKDLQDIRGRSRKWYESESIIDFCQSLQDSVILCDNAIEDLQVLYHESDNIKSKLEILSKILEFEERKTHFFEKTHAVQKYIVR
jgi:IS30 family transposase